MDSIMKKLYLTAVSLLRMIYYFPQKPSKLFYDKSSNKDVFIFGNGPTLAEALNNLNYFIDKDVLVVNHFAQTEEFAKIKPKFYVLVDPGFFKAGEEIDHNHTKRINTTMDMLVEKTNWNIRLLISWQGYNSKSFMDKISQNPHILPTPINTTKINGFSWFRHRCYKYNLGMPSSQTVILPSIFCAVNLGYNNIFLLGCENSWIKNIRVNDKNQLCIYDEHFYDNNNETLTLVSETEPYKYTIYTELLSSAKVFYAHRLINEYAIYRGIKIWNATPGSFIDAYERCKKIF